MVCSSEYGIPVGTGNDYTPATLIRLQMKWRRYNMTAPVTRVSDMRDNPKTIQRQSIAVVLLFIIH